MPKGNKTKLYIGEAEVDAEELREHFTTLMENADGDELRLISRTIRLIHDFNNHKHKQPLYDAVRNEPELFQSKTFRVFVADLLDGSYKPKTGTTSKSRAERSLRIVATVEYFKNMGIPSHYESTKNKLNASLLTAKRLNVSPHTVKDELKTSNREGAGFSQFVDKGLSSNDGAVIWVLNGFSTPSSEADISELEHIFLGLSSEETKEVQRFCRGYNPHILSLPETQKQLSEIEKVLNGREGYELIKRIQRHSIGLKPV